MPPYPDYNAQERRPRDTRPPAPYPSESFASSKDTYDPTSQRPRRPRGYEDASPSGASTTIPPPPIGPFAKPKKGYDTRSPAFPEERSYLASDAPDLERKVSPRNREFREKRDGYESDEGDQLRKAKRGGGGESERPRRKDRAPSYADNVDPRDIEPDPRRDARRTRPPGPGQARGSYYGEEAPVEPPRRRNTERAPPSRRTQYNDDDDDDDYDPRQRRAPPRRRGDEDEYYDRGYRSEERTAPRRPPAPRDDRGYRSHGEDGRQRRRRDSYDDDDSYDRPRRQRDDTDPRRRSDYGANTRAGGDDYWREKSRDRGNRRTRFEDEDRYDDRERDRDRDRRHREKSRDRKDKDKRKWNERLNKDDFGKYVKTGQKHYEQWAPVLMPVAKSLAKTYFDSRK
ncbi:MAG: hypothetical protein M1820_006178 [Bogoriella megaspora]|nr:MAG: hypothetical protein M1820_006178 [Bogoriella megaspora]